MGFIGNKPADTFHTTVKQSFTADSSTTSFTLNQSVAGENEIELFINIELTSNNICNDLCNDIHAELYTYNI